MMMMIAPRHLDHSGCQRSALGRDTSAVKTDFADGLEPDGLKRYRGGSNGRDNTKRGCVTSEEMERRRRRRERNKVAAAKCRNKKKERTEFLLQESEILEVQNSRLKSLIEKLRGERRRLELALSQHRGACRAHGDADESEQRLVLTQLTEQRGP
ncbi:unnamed protein product [Lampetra fluviatilis]